MDISVILTHLNNKFGCSLSSEYYTKIKEWKDWWRGYHKPFHSFREMQGDHTVSRDLYTLRMAKKVCEDWAAILLNEKTELVVEDNAGDVFLKDVFAQNDFWQQGNALVERAFYSGTGAFVLKLHNLKVSANGNVIKSLETKIHIDYLDAMQIVPLSIVGGKITEAAFVSEQTVKGKSYVYLETHTLENGNYLIENSYFSADGETLTPKPVPQGVSAQIRTGTYIPWFAIVTPNLVNNSPSNNGLGLSIYANAIDGLKGVDLVFNNFCRDFKLGGKKVFYNKNLIQQDENGNTITPDDIAQQLFMQIDGSLVNMDAESLVHEFNPDLRVEDNRNGIQAQLDYLSFKVGLGTRHYQFQAERIMTATQYVGDRQELIQNASKHYILVERALQQVVHGIMSIGKTICGLNVKEDAEVTVKFEDSYIIDKDSERERDRQDCRDGVMQWWEYRVKWYGEDEDTAKKMIVPTTLKMFPKEE